MPLQSFTQCARKDLIFDREKAYTPIVGAYREVTLFQDRTQSTNIPIAESFQPYSVDKLVHASYQLIASGLKQLSREAIWFGSLVVCESLYRNSDLVMVGRRYLYPIVVEWCQFAVFSSDGMNVAVTLQ